MNSQLIAQEIGGVRAIRPMSSVAIDKVRELEKLSAQRQQIPIYTRHHLHAGVYARTVIIPAGSVMTSALIKIATLLIVSGEALVYVGDDEPLRIVGQNQVIAASAHRKAAFHAIEETHLTMVFADKRGTRPVDAKADIAECEDMFTDEGELLVSRREPQSNIIIITGE